MTQICLLRNSREYWIDVMNGCEIAKVRGRQLLKVGKLPAGVEPLVKEIHGLAKDMQLAAAGDRIIVLTGHPVGVVGGTRALIVEDIV